MVNNKTLQNQNYQVFSFYLHKQQTSSLHYLNINYLFGKIHMISLVKYTMHVGIQSKVWEPFDMIMIVFQSRHHGFFLLHFNIICEGTLDFKDLDE